MDPTTIVTRITPVSTEAERAPLPPAHVEEPITLSILGASGDLTHRKLAPALFALFSQGVFRDRFTLLGFARREYTDEVFRAQLREAIKAFSRVPVDDSVLDQFISQVYYHKGNLDDPGAYSSLAARFQDTAVFPPNHVFYLAVTADLFQPAIAGLKQSGLIHAPHAKPWSRVVVEKPFGRDFESARNLNLKILSQLDETQIYRIDHYLGKETVQNILGFRLANSIFEPLFNHHYVDHIQITASETVGMEGSRGAYYDSAGALRDMVQNHLLQLLCLVTMEPPSNLTADAIRGAKVQLLQALLPPPADSMNHNVIRGQYSSGIETSNVTPAYTQESRVAADSKTESYCAVRLTIENWRWAGVPVYLRTGKRLKKRFTEIVMQFKKPSLQLFQTVECLGDVCDLTLSHPNVLVFRIQPDEGIALQFSAKRPATQFVVESVAMDFSYSHTWNQSLPEAYERLLLDVMRRDPTLFTRSDEVEAAWQVVDPVLRAWESRSDFPLHDYPPGSWGPRAADELLMRDGRAWNNPD